VRFLYLRLITHVALLTVLAAATAAASPLSIPFSASVNVSNLAGLSQAAVIAADDAGALYTCWEERSLELLLCSRSDDGGATFTSGLPVVPGGEFLSFGQARLASAEAGDLRVVFTSFDTFGGGAEIAYAASSDGAETFPVRGIISDIDNVNSHAPDLGLGWGVAVTWSEADLFLGATAINLVVSEDDGASFSPPVRIDTALSSASCSEVELFGGDNVYATWIQNDAPFAPFDAEEIVFARSFDRGGSFEPAINVSNNDEKSWCPRLAVDAAGTIYIVWAEGDFAIDMKLLFSRSVDGGETFSTPQSLAGPVFDLAPTVVTFAAEAVWVAWYETADGATYEGKVRRSLDSGATFSDPADMPGGYEIVATGRDDIALAWHSPQADPASDVFVSTAVVSPCGDANDDGAVSATDALIALQAAIGLVACEPARCNVDGSGDVSASDALAILNVAVGIAFTFACPA
jgi:hypothetical protein